MGLTVGVDVGGTKIAAAVIDEDGSLVEETRRDTPAADSQRILAAILDAISDLTARHRIEAVGISAAGFVDEKRATILFAPNLVWRDEPLREEVQRGCGLPTIVENDANAAAWGEFRFGATRSERDLRTVAFLTIGTGLGGGLIVGGELFRGGFGVGGEVGHLRVVPNGHRCGCGNRGCWEQYASGSALVREAREFAGSGSPRASRLLELAGGRAESIEGHMVSAAASEGDPLARELIEDLGRWLGEGIATLAAVLDPAVVVVGGGVSSVGDVLLDPARRAFERQLTGRGHRPVLEIRQASLGNGAGLIGAGDLARR